MIIGMIIYYASLVFGFTAVSLGPVSLVVPISAVQPFFVLLYSIFLTKFAPNILKEEITKETLFMKLSAIVLVFIGTLLIVM